MPIPIRGPFSYSGNKYRIYSKNLKEIMLNFERVHEPFCGSAVCLYNANNGGIGIDIDSDVIALHNSLFDKELIPKIQESYLRYFPKGKTKEGFYQLRKDFNQSWIKTGTTPENIHLLHLALQLSFNSLLRFSKNGFSCPYGWKDMHLEKIKIHQDIILNKNIQFFQGDYRELDLSKVDKEQDLIYFDPPYLASIFKYGGWNLEDEIKLLDYLDEINLKGYKFLLSNTFLHRGLKNDYLIEWSKKYDVKFIDMSYSAWSSSLPSVKAKKDTIEVVIKDFDTSKPLF